MGSATISLHCNHVGIGKSRSIYKARGDEYDYRPTPLANQIADLQDDDRDGVINARDLCPDTPKGSEIDNDGCGTFVKSSQMQQLHILFANDSSSIEPAFLTQIRQMAEFLQTILQHLLSYKATRAK